MIELNLDLHKKKCFLVVEPLIWGFGRGGGGGVNPLNN